MSKREEMQAYLPAYYDESPQMQELLKTQAQDVQKLRDDIRDGLDQFTIDTATWGLSRWETMCDVTTDESKPLVERRSVVQSKVRGIGKVDANLIKLRCDAYTNGDVEVRFDGVIKVTFTSILGAPPNLQDLQQALEEIKPAHLRLEYEFRYLLINQVHDTMTLDAIQQRPLTDFAPVVPI